MDPKTRQFLFALLRSAICGKPLSTSEKVLFTQESLHALMEISAKHDVSHLVAYAVSKNDLVDSDRKARLDKHVMKSVLRFQRLDQDFHKLCAALEAAQIPFLPLKGAVLRKYYTEPWMRTSCDIDILVPPEKVDETAAFLVDRLQYTYNSKTVHDISLYTPQKNHIELHFTLLEEGRANAAPQVLNTVWETAQLHDGSCFHYEMPTEMFCFYHIAHMAKHFEYGGCGIRPFIDLWILDNLPQADKTKQNALLEEGGLLVFANTARRLSKVWFDGEAHDAVTRQMEDFILRGGVYGTKENFVTLQQQKKGGQLQYALSRIFMPYDIIKYQYPILQKHKWLTPVIQIYRWLRILFRGRSGHALQEFQYNSQISNEEASSMQQFLKNIGL